MVWGLFPSDPLPGEDRYYIFGKGTYKVGRKGCDVIVNKDKGVSRIHAEIKVDAVTSLESLQGRSSDISFRVRIRDCSKYGTFINKNLALKEKVHELPNKEATLKDGDLVSFGTGNATYRFCFVPLKFLVYYSEPLEANQLLEQKISLIGASMTHIWSPDCTHVLVNQFMPLTEDLIDPFVAKKPFVLNEWVEVLAGKSICTEIPNCSSYAPTLLLEGVSVKVADPKSRENCLRGYTFLLDSMHKYKFKDKLFSLLEIVSAKVVSIEQFSSDSQGLEGEEDYKVVIVVPSGLAQNFVSSHNLSSLSRVKENDLICSAFSGHLDPSVMIAAPVVVSSSCSTDETVVADSDVEAENAISVDMSTAVNIKESTKNESKEEFFTINAAARLQSDIIAFSSGRDNTITERRDQADAPESGNPDIIYSQNLIVRDTNFPASAHSLTDNEVPNFKCFKKSRMPSGNSFNNLIPFSKYPYKESDHGSEVIVGFAKEEKKRKQMESMAEDLFNSEKVRRRRVAGSFHGLFPPS
ncbi:nibrin homolog [Diospyros lotus]|uniref:nibrin homolog n=1 Tax=Diospyros lotus TaxID=55363 RepID=UPI002257B62A|nr:nibrin homolog [Diospyros lotus]